MKIADECSFTAEYAQLQDLLKRNCIERKYSAQWQQLVYQVALRGVIFRIALSHAESVL
jgi:hypothetical protein